MNNLMPGNDMMMNLPPPCRLVHVLVRPAGFVMSAHQHDYYQVIQVTTGTLDITTEQGELTIEAGQAVVLAPGTKHALSSRAGYSQIGIDLSIEPDERGIRLLFARTFSQACTVLAIPDAPVNFAQIQSKICELTDISRLIVANLAERLLLHLLDIAARAGDTTFLDRFLALMGTDEARLLDLEGLCRKMQLSKTQLERQVRAAFQCGAVEYVNRLRLSRACLLLQTTDLPIRAISQMLGFYDESHFQSFFKRRLGLPPGRYRTNERVRQPGVSTGTVIDSREVGEYDEDESEERP